MIVTPAPSWGSVIIGHQSTGNHLMGNSNILKAVESLIVIAIARNQISWRIQIWILWMNKTKHFIEYFLPLQTPLSSWPLGIWYGHLRIKVFNATRHPMRGRGKVWDCPAEPFSSPSYSTLLLTPGKLLSIQTFLEGQSVIPVLRILLCLQRKHMMNNLLGTSQWEDMFSCGGGPFILLRLNQVSDPIIDQLTGGQL